MERSDFAIVVTTLPSEEEALKLADKLVESQLAACVHITPIRSLYRWEGKTEIAEEYKLEMKTRREHFDAIVRFLNTYHPYDIPEILLLPIESTSQAYGQWIMRSTGLFS